MIYSLVYTKGYSFLSLMDLDEWIISVLIVDDNEMREKVKKYIGNSNKVKKIVTWKEFFNNEDMKYLSSELINDNYQEQIKFYHYLHRFTTDIQEISDSYYRSLAYMEKILNENKIDVVINMNFNHGHCDYLLTRNAVKRGLYSYNIEPMLSGKMIVYNNVRDELVPILDNNQQDIRKSLFYKVDFNAYNRENEDRYTLIKVTIGKLFYSLFGMLGWLFLSGISRFKFTYNDMFRGKNLFEYSKNYFRLLYAKRYMKRLEKFPNYTDSYVFYPLHFEPEATIDGRSNLVNQLEVIRMIANSLPRGWLCYVKEHPHQFKVNTHSHHSFLYSSGNFKTTEFYRRLGEIKRVKVVKSGIDSEELIKKSRAVAIMSGTVGAEAIKYNKPVIVFAGKRTIYRKCKSFYCVNSYGECEEVMKKIFSLQNKTYEDFYDICNEYLVDDDIEGFKNAMRSIDNDMLLKNL